jgi:hypothetical protein
VSDIEQLWEIDKMLFEFYEKVPFKSNCVFVTHPIRCMPPPLHNPDTFLMTRWFLIKHLALRANQTRIKAKKNPESHTI